MTVIQDGQNFALEILDKVKEKMKEIKKEWKKESIYYNKERREMYYETYYLRAIIRACQLRNHGLQLEMMENNRQTHITNKER